MAKSPFKIKHNERQVSLVAVTHAAWHDLTPATDQSTEQALSVPKLRTVTGTEAQSCRVPATHAGSYFLMWKQDGLRRENKDIFFLTFVPQNERKKSESIPI